MATNEDGEESFIENLKSKSEEELRPIVDSLIADTKDELVHDDKVNDRISETNATGYTIDDYNITDIEIDDEKVIVNLDFSASGDNDPDRPFSGDTISGTAIATIDEEKRVSYEVIDAEVADEHEDDEEKESE